MAKRMYKKVSSDTFGSGDIAGNPAATVGSLEEREEMEKLTNQLKKVQLEFVEYTKDRIGFEKSLESQTEQATQMTRLYCRTGMMLCLAPLRKGINVNSIIKTIGLWTCACMFSKTFREELNYTVRETMYPAIVKKAEKAGPGSTWDVKRKQIEAEQNGGYLPFTPDSAAILKIAFCQQAYTKMREEGADVEQILRDYHKAEETLYRHAEKDGVSRQALDRSMRTIVGNLIEANPDGDMIMAETAYGVVTRGANTIHEQHIKEINGVRVRTYEKWEGRYNTADGEEYVGAFNPRMPESINDIRQMRRNLWIMATEEAETPEEMMEALYSPDVMNQQNRYLKMIMIDNGLSEEDLDHLNDFTMDTDDLRWMLDYGGDDPFTVDGMDMNIEDFLRYGPVQKPSQSVGKMPELKTAIGLWMNEHNDYNPGYWQQKANEAYKKATADGKELSTETAGEIVKYLEKRNELEKLWADLMKRPSSEYSDRWADRTKKLALQNKQLKDVSQRLLPGDKDKPAMDLALMRSL